MALLVEYEIAFIDRPAPLDPDDPAHSIALPAADQWQKLGPVQQARARNGEDHAGQQMHSKIWRHVPTLNTRIATGSNVIPWPQSLCFTICSRHVNLIIV